MRFTVVCSMKNEGPYIVEWVSWYRRLGFDNIVVVTNDCTDHSPQLLDALASAGWITHLPHVVTPDSGICAQKLAAAKTLPEVAGADWVLVCDVDEFLVIHKGAGEIRDLVPEDAPFLGMAINWRVFGTGGNARWSDGLTHRQFLHCAEAGDRSGRWIKCIHQRPGWFRRLGEHGPKWLAQPRAAKWGTPPYVWVDADQRVIDSYSPRGDYMRKMPAGRQTYATAQMNHYMVRSYESYMLKMGQKSSVAGHDRYTLSYFEWYDRNENVDRSALAHATAFDRIHAEAMELPGVRALHHACCADYLTRLCAVDGRDPAQDPRFIEHMALADLFRP